MSRGPSTKGELWLCASQPAPFHVVINDDVRSGANSSGKYSGAPVLRRARGQAEASADGAQRSPSTSLC